MILVLSGTRDGREIVEQLTALGQKVIATVVSEYGARLLSSSEATVAKGALTEEELATLVTDKKIKIIIDATHPYADKISKLARNLAEGLGITYLRYQRPGFPVPGSDLIHRAKDYQEAAQLAFQLGERVFLTTGSKTLKVFTDRACQVGKKVIARVLPTPEVISYCRECGLTPAEIIAMQGPFSKETNIAMLRQTGAQVLVTKDSGDIGGAGDKIEAALELKIPVVLILRPKVDGTAFGDIAQLMDAIKEIL